MVKMFEAAAKEAASAEPVQPEEFAFADRPDQTLRIYPPNESQQAMMMSVMAGMVDGSVQIATIINVFMSMLDTESAGVVRRRLLDRDDSLSFEQIVPIIEWLVEETADRPTQSSPASTPSPPPSGPRSTAPARQRASTRSSSRSAASATSSTPGP